MKCTMSLFLLLTGTLLFFSCKKEEAASPSCENCILLPPDSLQKGIDSLYGPTIVINRGRTNISLATTNDSTNLFNSDFVISMGQNGSLMTDESFRIDTQTLNRHWEFEDIAPGTYPVRIRQMNYDPATGYPVFEFVINSSNGNVIQTVNPSPRSGVTASNEMEYGFTLQVNP